MSAHGLRLFKQEPFVTIYSVCRLEGSTASNRDTRRQERADHPVHQQRGLGRPDSLDGVGFSEAPEPRRDSRICPRLVLEDKQNVRGSGELSRTSRTVERRPETGWRESVGRYPRPLPSEDTDEYVRVALPCKHGARTDRRYLRVRAPKDQHYRLALRCSILEHSVHTI
jgi:hypothetical protein